MQQPFKEDAWHYTEESLRLLSLSIVQINGILGDGGQSIAELTDSFIHIANKIDDLLTDNQQTTNSNELRTIHEKVHQGIVAFQFYDRLSQRLEHVSQSLVAMSEIIANKQQREQPEYWQRLQTAIKQKYTMHSERFVFDQVMRGDSIDSALLAYQQQRPHDDHQADVELF